MATGEKKSSTSKVVTNPNGTPDAGNVNTPHSGHATPTKTKSKVFGKIVSTIFIIALIILLIVFIAWAGPFVKQAWNKIVETRPKTETVKPPDVITETYPLNKDSKMIRVYTHDGYDYERYSGGWKYYCTPENGVKTLRGDGNSKKDGTVRYFDLEFYEVDCIITVIFTRKNKK